VETAAAYSIQPAAPDPIGMAALLKGQIDVATFISPSGLTGLEAMLTDRSLAEALAPVTVLCIGPTTAEAARALNVRVDLVAKKYTVDGLIETLLEWRKVEIRE
jgi:uroporphyrinogen III methyltransferase/synthase